MHSLCRVEVDAALNYSGVGAICTSKLGLEAPAVVSFALRSTLHSTTLASVQHRLWPGYTAPHFELQSTSVVYLTFTVGGGHGGRALSLLINDKSCFVLRSFGVPPLLGVGAVKTEPIPKQIYQDKIYRFGPIERLMDELNVNRPPFPCEDECKYEVRLSPHFLSSASSLRLRSVSFSLATLRGQCHPWR